MSEKQELVAILETVARAWLERDWSAMAGALHRDVVFRGPDGLQAIEGRETCLNSYVAFMEQAEVEDFQAGEAVIDLMSDVAMVLQPWSIRYRMDGSLHSESGRDAYLFRREDGRWQLIWRGAVQVS